MTIDELKSKGITSFKKVTEYLSRSDRGFFFLPDNLAKLTAELAQSKKPESCINLNSNLGEILSHCNQIKNKIGVDINVQNIELAKYLNPSLHFENLDPLSYTSTSHFDSVICFPPLGQRIQVNGRRLPSEQLYLNKSLELLSEQGTAVFIVANNFLTAPVFEELRNTILEKYGLETVISLPKGILRNTGVDLSILVINHDKTKATKYFKIKDRAFSNTNLSNSDFSVLKDNLVERWDYKFHNPKNREYEKELKNQETKRVTDLVEVVLGTHFSRDEIKEEGDFLWLTMRNVINGNLTLTDNDKFISKKEFSRREQNAILQNGDILIPRIQRNKESFYIHTDTEKKIIAFQHFIILRGKNADYVATYLNTDNGIKLFNQQIERHARGNVMPTISISDLKNIEIPILPIEDLELASKRKLEKLSYNELLVIKEKYEKLKIEYQDSKDSHRQILEIMQQNHSEVMSTMGRIENKVDEVKSILTELVSDFNSIKKLPREIDDRINRLNQSLDTKLNELISDQKQLDFYITEIKRWFDFYDLLETKSKKYLPEAEYIFDHISKLENPDYSPFILQYCRALENELLKKIFRAYVQSLIDREIDITKEFEWDFGRKESGKPNSENTFKLAKHIQRCLKKSEDEWFFELGSMEVNLRYLTGKTAGKSPLLIDLKSFVLDRFEQEILNIEYLDEIKTIIRDYRNQSAHPNLIDTEKAVKFHKEMKECLISLMENYKK
ncbi:MAG: N-6 DNA methylase [Brumimicrobium sp.]